METTTTTTLALVAMLAMAGIGMVPTATANQQCDEDFNIPDSEPLLSRFLAASANEIGLLEVSPGSSVDVEIKLESSNSELVFPIWFEDTSGCEEATSIEANCGVDKLETMLGSDSTTCTLKPHSSVVRAYFFDFENVGSAVLEYVAFEV